MNSMFLFLRWSGMGIGLALGMAGCRPPPPSPPAPIDLQAIDGARALAEAHALIALGPRVAGTDGARRAADHLGARLRALGIEPLTDAFEDETPEGVRLFRNVLGVWPGTGDTWVVLGSHYDTKNGVDDAFVGANDSGSSSGLLLELARALAGRPPLPFQVLFAFFDGEECRQAYGPRDGLHGSRRLARQLREDGRARRVRAVVVLDMIGDRDLSVTLPRNGASYLLAAAFRAAAEEGVRDRFALWPGHILDDHQPFLDAGMPAIDLIDFQYGSAPGLNDFWHTPLDTPDKLSATSLGVTGRVTARLLNALLAQPHAFPTADESLSVGHAAGRSARRRGPTDR